MIYITDNPNIKKHITDVLHVATYNATNDINSVIQNQLIGTFLLIDEKPGDLEDIDLLITCCDIAIIGSFPKIKKGDLVIIREGDKFLYKEV